MRLGIGRAGWAAGLVCLVALGFGVLGFGAGRVWASAPDLLGFGMRTSGMGATGTAHVNGYESTYANPAGLTNGYNKRLTVGYLFGTYDLGMSQNLMRIREPRADNSYGLIIGASIPFNFKGWLRKKMWVGMGFYLPTGMVTRARVPLPGQPHFSLLESRTQVVGSYTVYFTAEAADGAAHILRAAGVDLANEPREVSVVLEVDAAWEATRLAHPAVLKPGLDGAAYGLFYEAGAGEIGYADSPDGHTFTRHADNPILSPMESEEGAWLGHPTAVWHEDVVMLYYTAGPPGSLFAARITVQSGGAICVERLDADPITAGRTPVLAPNPLLGLFDEMAVGGPSISISNEAGRAVFDLWYAGRRADGDWSVGFAGSYDGLLFKRFEDNPVVKSGVPVETDPCVVAQSVSAVMFYTHGEGLHRTIGAARY